MRRRPHLTRWALLIYRSSRLSCAAKAAIRSFSWRRSRSIATRRVFAASNCFLIAATCVGERVGASVMLSGYSDATVKLITGLFRELETDASAGRAEGLRRSMLALIDRGQAAFAMLTPRPTERDRARAN